MCNWNVFYQYILSAVLYVWGSSCFGSAALYGVAIHPSSLKLLNLPYSGWLAMGLENPVTSGTFVSSKRLNFRLVLLETIVS
jgi:hypothetical protein